MSNVIYTQEMTDKDIPFARIGRVEIREQMFDNAIVDGVKVLHIERVVWMSDLERVWETIDPRIVPHKVDRLVVSYQLRDERILFDSGRSEVRADVDKGGQGSSDDSFESLHT
jgi:hypothetical protein